LEATTQFLIVDINESVFEVDFMSQTRSQRGRPKGTGLNDHARLMAVAELIAKNPELKPTTAIKSIGVSDPSTIRRLRDKFHSVKNELVAELDAPSEKQAPARTRSAALNIAGSAKSKAAAPTKPAIAAPAQTEPMAPPAPLATVAPAAADPAQWMALWYGLGLQSFSSAVALQISFLEKVMRMPQVATALRGQLALNEMAVAWYPAPARKDKTLH
jgi:hypothetical protein